MLKRHTSTAAFSFFLVFCLTLLFSVSALAQEGGARRERKAKSKGAKTLGAAKSKGHADEFARGNSGRRGRLARLFRRDRPAWQYKSSGSKRSQNKENRDLFTRQRSKGKMENDTYQEKENARRSRNRDHGNKTFKKKKYKKR